MSIFIFKHIFMVPASIPAMPGAILRPAKEDSFWYYPKFQVRLAQLTRQPPAINAEIAPINPASS